MSQNNNNIDSIDHQHLSNRARNKTTDDAKKNI